jgi:protein involved in polysaccharide export with SLBB domain
MCTSGRLQTSASQLRRLGLEGIHRQRPRKWPSNPLSNMIPLRSRLFSAPNAQATKQLGRSLIVGLLLFHAVPRQLVAQATPTGSPSALALRPGDMIRVKVYREPDLNGEYLVDLDGSTTLPLIGEQQVTGVPIRELRLRLVEAYKVHLQNPSIEITPLRRIQILGEVQKPGLYPIDPTVTVAGAIAMAGGATTTGDITRIRIIRDGASLDTRVGVATALTSFDIRSGDEIIVDQKSWFTRNSPFVISAVLSATSIITSLIIATRN